MKKLLILMLMGWFIPSLGYAIGLHKKNPLREVTGKVVTWDDKSLTLEIYLKGKTLRRTYGFSPSLKIPQGFQEGKWVTLTLKGKERKIEKITIKNPKQEGSPGSPHPPTPLKTPDRSPPSPLKDKS